jgi:hypothetical protein
MSRSIPGIEVSGVFRKIEVIIRQVQTGRIPKLLIWRINLKEGPQEERKNHGPQEAAQIRDGSDVRT